MMSPLQQEQKESPATEANGALPIAELGQLHWVKRPLSTLSVLAATEEAPSTASNTNENDEAPGLWWPSLLFNDYDDFQDFFVNELKPESENDDENDDAAETKGLILTRMFQNMLQQKSIMIARLLGRSIRDYVEIVEISADGKGESKTNLEAHQALQFVSFTRMPQQVHLPQMKPEAFIVVCKNKTEKGSTIDEQTTIIDDELYMSYMLALDLAATRRMSGMQAPNKTLRSDFRKLGRAELARLSPNIKKLSDEASISYSESNASASDQVDVATAEDRNRQVKTKGRHDANGINEKPEEDSDDSDSDTDSDSDDEDENEHKVGDEIPQKTATVENFLKDGSLFPTSPCQEENLRTDQGYESEKGPKTQVGKNSAADQEDRAESKSAPEASVLPKTGTDRGLDATNLANEHIVTDKKDHKLCEGDDADFDRGEESAPEASVLREAGADTVSVATNVPNYDNKHDQVEPRTYKESNRAIGNGRKSALETLVLPEADSNKAFASADLPTDDNSSNQADSEIDQDANGDSVQDKDEIGTNDGQSLLASPSATVVSNSSEGQDLMDVSEKKSLAASPRGTRSSPRKRNLGQGTNYADSSTTGTSSPATAVARLPFSPPKKPRKKGRPPKIRPPKIRPPKMRLMKDASQKTHWENSEIDPRDSFDQVCFKLELEGWTIDAMVDNYLSPAVGYNDIKMNPQWRGKKFFLGKTAFIAFLKETYGWQEKKARTGNSMTPSPPNRPKRTRRSSSFCGDDIDTPSPRRKQFHFESAQEKDFYQFRRLIMKLQSQCNWKYIRGTKLHPWLYVLPGCKTEVQGGQHLVDFFAEESEVIQYCMDHRFYERRRELGLEKENWKM